jgi:hypothetical protein
MTFKDLRNELSKIQVFSDNKLDILTDKPFWIWNKEIHIQEHDRTNGYCSFNHSVSKVERYCSPCLEKEKVRKY